VQLRIYGQASKTLSASLTGRLDTALTIMIACQWTHCGTERNLGADLFRDLPLVFQVQPHRACVTNSETMTISS